MATGDFPCPNCGAYHHGFYDVVPPCLMASARNKAAWAVWDHEDTSRWGNQLNREAFVKLVKDPMKAMG